MSLVRLVDQRSAPLLMRPYYEGGDPGPLVGAFAQVPELAEVALPFVGASLGASAVSFRHKEIAILRTSANLSCRFCVDAHTVVAYESGLDDSEVAALRGEGDLTVFDDPTEMALIDWIDAVSTGTGAVSDEIAERAKAALGDHRLVEITVTIGSTMLLNRFASSLRLPTSAETIARLASHGHGSFQPAQPVSIGRSM